MFNLNILFGFCIYIVLFDIIYYLKFDKNCFFSSVFWVQFVLACMQFLSIFQTT